MPVVKVTNNYAVVENDLENPGAYIYVNLDTAREAVRLLSKPALPGVGDCFTIDGVEYTRVTFQQGKEVYGLDPTTHHVVWFNRNHFRD